MGGDSRERRAPAISPQRHVLQPHEQVAPVVEYLLPTAHSVPGRLAAADDGSIWFAATAGDRILRITASGMLREFPLPAEDCRPDGTCIAPDGAVWFYEGNGLSVDRLKPDGGLVRFAVPASGPRREPCQPSSIAVGPDGTVWFAEHPDHWLGTIRPDGAMSEVPVPAGHGAPCTLCGHPDGSLWFADCGGSRIGRIDPGGAVTSFRRPAHDTGQVSAMTDCGGGVAYVDIDRGIAGRVTETGTFTEWDHPCLQGATDIRPGPRGSLWVATADANAVLGFTADGSAVELPLPTASSRPASLVVAPDGSLWVAEATGNRVARMPASLMNHHLAHGAPVTADVLGRVSRGGRSGCVADRPRRDRRPQSGRGGPLDTTITAAE